jgi:hypothetical protein
MNQPDPADGLESTAYEDEFSEGFEGADAAADELSPLSADFAGDTPAGEEDFGGDAMEAGEAWDEGADLMAGDEGEDFADAGWQAFEAEVADALDEAGSDEFLGRMLGGLSRVAGRVLPMAQRALGGAARSGQLGQAAQGLARLLGGGAQGGRAPAGARARGGMAAAGGAAGGIASLLGQLMAQQADDFEAFDEMADAYEDGVDEALPAIVGLAARGLARGLGHRNVSQLGQAARRALVRGVATAARTLVNHHGPRGARVLGRLAHVTGRAAARGAQHPRQAAQRIARTLPRVAQRVAQQRGAVQRLARPLTRRRLSPAARVRGVRPPVGTAGPGTLRRPPAYAPVGAPGYAPDDAPAYAPDDAPAGAAYHHPTTRVLRLRGPVDIVIRQR